MATIGGVLLLLVFAFGGAGVLQWKFKGSGLLRNRGRISALPGHPYASLHRDAPSQPHSLSVPCDAFRSP